MHKNTYLLALIPAFLFGSFLMPDNARAQTAPAGFQVENYISGLNMPTSFAFAPDGRIFIAEKSGKVRLVKNGVLQATPVYTVLRINDFGDRGLIGIALDPQFATNGYMYLSYTYENSPGQNYGGTKTGQIIRVTVSGDTASDASKIVLVGSITGDAVVSSCNNFATTSDCIPSDGPTHSMGGLRFGPDGKLYATLGDGAKFEEVDSRAMKAQSIDSLAGKVLRLNSDGTAPTDNPFYNGNNRSNRSRVWAYGLRNAFRFNFRPATGSFFLGDVGWTSWEELNKVSRGNNLGWPCREGRSQTPGYNCTLTGYTDPIYVYDHSAGSGAISGIAFPSNNAYPAAYMTSLYMADYAQNWIKKVNLNSSEGVASVENFITNAGGPVDILTGPDGRLYYLAIYTGQLKRIVASTANRPPVAFIGADKASGPVPLTINFSSAGTNDPDNDALTYSWSFGDGGTSSLPNPQKIYSQTGSYTATLTVRDNKGGVATKSMVITAGNPPTTGVNVRHLGTAISPIPTYIGREATLTTRISNSGAAEAILIDIEVYNSAGTKVAQKIYENEIIPTGTSRNFDLTWLPSVVGDYTAKVGLFTPGWTRLHEWTDRALAFRVEDRSPTTPPPSTTTPPATTFTPVHLRTIVNPGTGPVSQIRGISTTVKNEGTSGSMLVDIEIYNSAGVRVGQKFFDNEAVSAGAERAFDFHWQPTQGGTYRVAIGHFAPGWARTYNWIANAATITVSGDGGTTPPPATTTPPTTPPPTSAIYLYRDALETGWDTSWSWGSTIILTSTDTAQEGTRSIKLRHDSPWGGIYFRNVAAFSTSGKTTLKFAVHGGATGGQKIKVVTYDASGTPSEGFYLDPYISGGIMANSWKTVTIPLADIMASNRNITGFAIQEAVGGVTPTYYLDNIRLE